MKNTTTAYIPIYAETETRKALEIGLSRSQSGWCQKTPYRFKTPPNDPAIYPTPANADEFCPMGAVGLDPEATNNTSVYHPRSD